MRSINWKKQVLVPASYGVLSWICVFVAYFVCQKQTIPTLLLTVAQLLILYAIAALIRRLRCNRFNKDPWQ